MLKEAFDRNEVQRYVAGVRGDLGSDELREAVNRTAGALGLPGEPVAQLQAALPDVDSTIASSGGRPGRVPFLSRDPVHSLVQSSVEEKLRDQGVIDETPPDHTKRRRIVHTCESLLHPVRFGPDDRRWIRDIAGATLARLARGNHTFNPAPAESVISSDARIVIVGDWGTGLARARSVAELMAAEVSEAIAAGRQAHVIHLGDVYYSGLGHEVNRNVLAPGLWPVTTQQARQGVTSWSLNGNHDMYGGGFGYFDTLLGDERFAKQRSPDGRSTSFFRISSPAWDFVGLDTSWDADVLSQGHVGVLADPQGAVVERWARESPRKLCLLSHHQLTSVYSVHDIGTTLGAKLAPVLDRRRLTAWFWGHEHRCMGFRPMPEVPHARCIGHGGVPVQMRHDAPVPEPGSWEERACFEQDGDPWARFGFAVLDLQDDEIAVRYRNDTGATTRREQIA